MEIVSQDEAANMSFPDEEPTIIDVEPEELTSDSDSNSSYTASEVSTTSTTDFNSRMAR